MYVALYSHRAVEPESVESELLPRLNSSPVATTRLRIAYGLYQLVRIAEDHSGLGHMHAA